MSRRFSASADRGGVALALAAVVLTAGGCVRRTITITSEPAGALVWLNDREIGRTPVEVEFLYYGTYDVRLELPGREPLMTSGKASAPWWETPGVDLVAELLPGERWSRIEWHYELPSADDDLDALRQRAEQLRERTAADD